MVSRGLGGVVFQLIPHWWGPVCFPHYQTEWMSVAVVVVVLAVVVVVVDLVVVVHVVGAVVVGHVVAVPVVVVVVMYVCIFFSAQHGNKQQGLLHNKLHVTVDGPKKSLNEGDLFPLESRNRESC